MASAQHPRLWGRLLSCSAAFLGKPAGAHPPRVLIAPPDGSRVRTDQADAEERLREALGRSVALSAVPSAAAEIERWWPDVDGLALRDAVTSGPIALAAPSTFFDHAPVHLRTTPTLTRLRELAGGGDFDPSRFRPNLLVATAVGEEGFVEHGWVGRRVRVGGEVVLRVTDPSPRCFVPTLPQGGFSPDPGVLRAVVAHGRAPIPALGGHTLPSAGAYAVVGPGGTVRRGDRVAVDRDG